MKTTDNVKEGNGNVQNMPGTSSSPKGAEENTGVKDGIGIPNAPGNKSSNARNTVNNNNRRWHFSNERPIF